MLRNKGRKLRGALKKCRAVVETGSEPRIAIDRIVFEFTREAWNKRKYVELESKSDARDTAETTSIRKPSEAQCSACSRS